MKWTKEWPDTSGMYILCIHRKIFGKAYYISTIHINGNKNSIGITGGGLGFNTIILSKREFMSSFASFLFYGQIEEPEKQKIY